MQSNDVSDRLDRFRKTVDKLQHRLEFIELQKKKLITERTKYEASLNNIKEGSIIVNKAIEDTHRSLETSIVDVVNKALALVFTEPYTLSFKLSQRGSNTKTSQVCINLQKGGVDFNKSLTTSIEGGMLTVVSLMLRIAFLSLKPDSRKVLLLDETFGALSRIEDSAGSSALQRAFNLVQKISEEFGIQVILITHTGVESK